MLAKLLKQLTSNIDNKKSATLLHTLIVFIPALFVILLVVIIVIFSQEKMEAELHKESEVIYVDSKLKNIEAEIKHIIKDVFILKNNNHIQEYIENNSFKNKTEITNVILDIIQFQESYDQIRYIDKNGMEVIRVNYNNGKPSIVPQEKLQNKKDRYYFNETFILKNNEIFISPLDLNIENNKIESPLKPMIRFGTPIIDKNGNTQGILLFNYLADKIINVFNQNISLRLDNQLMLVNKDGYILESPNEIDKWGFMYENKQDKTIKNLYKNSWEEISAKKHSQFETEQGLFTFNTIYPLNKGLGANHTEDYYWKIVSFVPYTNFYAKAHERRKYTAVLLILVSIVLFIISLKLAKVQAARKKALLLLEASNKTKDKFFSIIAHDLRNPFNGLLGFSTLLTEQIKQDNKPKIKEYAEILHTTLKTTFSFLNNLLSWSRSQINGIEFKPEYFFLDELVNDVFTITNPQATKKKIELVNSIPQGLKIIADKNILTSVIGNLVTNAIKYSNTGGKININALIENHSLHCSIKDNGIGMSEERVQSLFELSHVESTPGTENEKGTGLGLILCKEFIKKHNGKIGVSSTMGKGSKFWFELPQIH